MYGGIINSGDANSIVVQPSENYKVKYTLDGSTITINKYQFWGQQGVYFISNADGTFLDKEVKKGDWLISTGSGVAKVDNTDAVSSVAGLTGVIDATALGKELSYNDLKDKPTLKTINGQSIVGSGDIEINSGNSDANVAAVDTGDVLDDVNISYATTAYVDGLLGDINSVLESIISGGDSISLITFTINGETYQAEEGMIWERWIDSEYNIINAYVDDVFINAGDIANSYRIWVSYDGGNLVYYNDLIISDHNYVLSD